ncbi:acyl carrier protein [Candidatus Micrarchaeota archaeon]|nr:acyl carrier protein [Candidatus Micrarchaeota archaeon]MBD3418435.1 acyl carrier protein [Candidatus Micrarchaeota archaeon]
MTSKKEVEKKVKKVVSDVFGVSEKKLTPKTSFVDDLHAKSMDIVELLAALEMEFGFRIPQRDVRQNKTLKEAVDYMYKKAKKFKK